jgi:leader peptidase (prepilin peptidase)/N-methyltransferase
MSDFFVFAVHTLARFHLPAILLSTTQAYLAAVLLGLLIGSFLSVVVYRLPIMLQHDWDEELRALGAGAGVDGSDDAPREPASPRINLWRPGSACTSCEHRLRPWENIPLLSYVIQRGRCSACHAPIGFTYPLLELCTMLLAVAAVWRFGATGTALCAFCFGASLLALAFIDARTELLPDALTLPLVWAGLLVNLGSTFVSPSAAIVGAAAGYVFLWTVYWLFKGLTGREGIGYGDFKLFAAIGAWLGWQCLPLILFGAAVAGALGGVVALLRGRMKSDQAIPFGPFLAVAALLATFGDTLLHRGLGG